jgi:hypothetical protein
MIPVSVEGQQRAEEQRLAGLAAEKGAKGGKRDRREREDREDGRTGADHMAEGAMASMAEDGDRDGDGALKAYQDVGAYEGPGEYMPPGQIAAQRFNHPYLGEGHAAVSPQHEPPNTMPAQAPTAPVLRHVDLSGSQALVAQVHPSAPSSPGGQR